MLERFVTQTTFSSQEDFKKNFHITIPEHFNYGYDVVDAWADEAPQKRALYADQIGRASCRERV